MKWYQLAFDRGVFCPHCGSHIDVLLDQFCAKCGKKHSFCFQCKHQMEESDRFCIRCSAESLRNMSPSQKQRLYLIAESAKLPCPPNHLRRVCRVCTFHWFVNKADQGATAFAAGASGFAYIVGALSGKRRSGKVREGKKMDKQIKELNRMATCPQCYSLGNYDEYRQ